MKNSEIGKMARRQLKTGTILLAALMAALCVPSCKKDGGTTTLPVVKDSVYTPAAHRTGVPVLSGMLDHSKFTMSSIIQVDLDRNVARLPLYKGTYMGSRVWFVRTDVSDSALATQYGLNFAPRLINADNGCPTCIQTVTSSDLVPGNAPVAFAGTVDFSPNYQLVAGPTGFPPSVAVPGSVGGLGYSDLVRVAGSTVVYNAPIIATGSGPFDVNQTHSNTLDRVVAIDTTNMTVDLQFIRAFSHGKDVFYFSFSATNELTAVMERGTFVAGMGGLPFPNDDLNPKGARSSIFTFTNGMRGLDNADAQGLTHLVLDNAPGNIGADNPALINSLVHFGDLRNILGSFPKTLADVNERNLYTPLWDLNIGVWSADAVSKGINYAQTDANTIRQLAKSNYITNDGGAKLSSANAVVNCPVIGFATDAPTADQAPRPAQ